MGKKTVLKCLAALHYFQARRITVHTVSTPATGTEGWGLLSLWTRVWCSSRKPLTCLCQGRKPVRLKPSEFITASFLFYWKLLYYVALPNRRPGSSAVWKHQFVLKSNSSENNSRKIYAIESYVVKNYCCYLHLAVFFMIYYYSERNFSLIALKLKLICGMISLYMECDGFQP